MKATEFPALYQSANAAAIAAQSSYMRMLVIQYFLLVTAATLSLWFGNSPVLYTTYALVITASGGLLIYASVKKPETEWYTSRALAESVKTLTWRYMMRAEPFGDAERLFEVQQEFSSRLHETLQANRQVGDSLAPSTADQITHAMNQVRSLPLQERKASYCTERIEAQRSWYVSKADINNRNFRRYVRVCATVYILAILLALLRIQYDSNWNFWPTSPLLIFASSIIGWIQIRKFNENASSYNLAAHEIGIIQTRIAHVSTEANFSAFVNEAEHAFSREHTQWTARQKT